MVDVPNVPGVPPLPSYAANNVSLLAADVSLLLAALSGPRWGVYSSSGVAAFPYNSFVDLDFKQDWPVSDYPVEEGGFQSYDKVQLPFDVRVRLASDGTEEGRAALIEAVAAAANSLQLYTVVSPEQAYPSCNITHVDYRRSATNGVGMVVIDVWFVEIRQTSTSNFSNTQTPTLAGQQSTGNVAAQPSTPQIEQGFNNGTSVLQ